MKSKHIYLNLFAIDYPLTALTSIIHRVTGIILFLFMPVILYFFELSIESSSSFIIAKNLFSNIYIKLLIYIYFSCFIYHALNGLKHIIIDLGYFDTKSGAKNFSLIILLIISFFLFLSILL